VGTGLTADALFPRRRCVLVPRGPPRAAAVRRVTKAGRRDDRLVQTRQALAVGLNAGREFLRTWLTGLAAPAGLSRCDLSDARGTVFALGPDAGEDHAHQSGAVYASRNVQDVGQRAPTLFVIVPAAGSLAPPTKASRSWRFQPEARDLAEKAVRGRLRWRA